MAMNKPKQKRLLKKAMVRRQKEIEKIRLEKNWIRLWNKNVVLRRKGKSF